MSIAIRRYEEADRPMVINRRLKQKSFGLGYWSAVATQGPSAISEAVKLQLRENPIRYPEEKF